MKAEELQSPALGRCLAQFERAEAGLPGQGLAWLKRARRDARERFQALGFPTLREEDWKYTSVASLEKRAFALAVAPAAVTAQQVAEFVLPGLESHLLVFVDGRPAPGLSRMGVLPAGVTVQSLAAAVQGEADRLQEFLARDTLNNGFAALNTALWTDGAYIHAGRGTRVENPVHLLFVCTAGEPMAQVRNLIVAEEGSELTVIEHYVGLAGAASFTNAVTRIEAGANAGIEHIRLQQEDLKAFHVGGVHAHQQRDSRFTSHSISLGAQLARIDISTVLDGPGCDATLNGLYMSGGRQHVDHHTRVDHAKPHGNSREFYRGVLDGASRAVFNGRVIVHADAQHTDAQQNNSNLLLSREAEVDTKPQLEIFADDVRCTHGATVGQLDTDMLFYLRSRGVGEMAARNLLTYAFANDVLSRIGLAPLRERLENILIGRLPEGESIREFL